MKFEDLKFRYTIPLAESEYGERGFIYDEMRRASDRNYMEFMCGEGLLMGEGFEAHVSEALKLMAEKDPMFPDGTTEGERVVAVVAAMSRHLCDCDEAGALGEEYSLQKKIDMYFAGQPICLPEQYHVHHGFPW
ncbi:MAG: hypothetical protein K6G94_06920 [Kiritimatiellae bacterium]|nr:hypothetical protein [Kiritimatiellia bacterium]